MNWLYLFVAIGLEIIGTTLLKLSAGFTKGFVGVFSMVFYVASLAMLALALKRIEVSVAYAVWSGIGIAAIGIIGILFFKESLTLPKIIFTALIIIGVVGLNIWGSGH